MLKLLPISVEYDVFALVKKPPRCLTTPVEDVMEAVVEQVESVLDNVLSRWV